MPKEMIKKVRALMKNKTRGSEPAEQPADTGAAVEKAPPKRAAKKTAEPPVAAEPVKKAVKPPAAPPAEKKVVDPPAAGAKKSAPRKKKPAEEMPEPLREVKRVRAREAATEEWRPSASRGGAETSGGSAESKEGGARKPRNRRPRRSGGGEKSAGVNRSEARREDRPAKAASAPRKSRSGGRRRQENAEGGDGPRKHVASRGKGFSFPRPKAEHGDWTADSYQVPEAEGKTRFADLGLPDELLHTVSDLGYQYCTPIQAGILPALLSGQDGLGQAQTGTGKTAAFLLAAFTRMLREPVANPKKGAPRVLIVAPTRELVLQIEEEAAEIGKYTPFQTLPVYGGLDFEAQKDALLDNVVDLVVATPGRLIDFLRKKVVDLSQVEILVLDEADRMLDMGFIPDVKRIVYATPHKDRRQTLFFSATFTDDVRQLAQSWTRDAVSVVIEPEKVAADTVDQTVFIVTDEQKFPLTVNLLRNLKPSRCLIFANRRDSSQYLCDRLMDYEFSCALLTGAVPQAKRVKTLERFKTGEIPIVVATDVAGRGIHVEDVELVINFNLPEDAEDYVHRIGRTGRAGAEGRSVGFADEMDAMLVPDIEKYLGRPLVCTHPEEAWLEVEPRERTHHNKRRSESRDRGGRSGGRGGSRGGGGRRPRSGGGRSRR